MGKKIKFFFKNILPVQKFVVLLQPKTVNQSFQQVFNNFNSQKYDRKKI